MTGTAFISQLRRQLSDAIKDAGGEYHAPDSALVLYLNDYVRYLLTHNPEAFYGTSVSTSLPEEITTGTLSSALPFTDAFVTRGVHYVCTQALVEDAESTGNSQLAALHGQLQEMEK